MKAITLRNIPPALARVLEEESRSSRTSLNKTVIRLLERATGIGSGARNRRFDDLDDLAGSWSEEEGRELDQAIAEQRKIDPEIWS